MKYYKSSRPNQRLHEDVEPKVHIYLWGAKSTLRPKCSAKSA